MKKKFNVGRFLRALSMAALITSLLCMCVVAVFARFKTEVSGSDSARVAKFDVDFSENIDSQVTISDENGCLDYIENNYTLTVTSKSEVAVSYTVTITFTKELPEAITLYLDETQFTTTDNKTYTAQGASFSADDTTTTKNHTLTFRVYMSPIISDENRNPLTDEQAKVESARILKTFFEDKVNLSVRAEQVAPTK